MNSTTDLNAFCQNLARSKLLTEPEVLGLRTRARNETGAAAYPEGLADWLVEQGKLTRYQADAVLRGNVRFFLDDYKLLERIGSGRMAGVYRAVHKMGLPVAIKVLPPSRAKEPDNLARFQREAHLALNLDHPHVVRTYHAGASDGLYYIAMEYLEGETLEERLAEKRKLPPLEAIRLLHHALQGLQHLHEKGIVHRDLKPGNLMLVPLPVTPGATEPAYTVKLLDVGLGRALFDESGPGSADLTADGAVLGTPDYLAPEQARNSHAADIRSDLYSLGCVLYECLAGQVPFPAKNVVQKLRKHATQMPAPPDLSPDARAQELQAVLWKLLAKDPALRYATPEAAAKALEPFLAVQVAAPVRAATGTVPMAAPVTPKGPPVPPPMPRSPVAPAAINVQLVELPTPKSGLRPLVLAVGGLGLVVLVLLVVVFLLLFQR